MASNTLLNALRQVTASREGLEKAIQAWWFPSRGCDEAAVEEGGLAIPERLAVWPVDQAARGQQHRMARRRVPLAGRRNSRIDVSLPLRDDAEFERRSDRNIIAPASGFLQIVYGRLIQVRLGRNRP